MMSASATLARVACDRSAPLSNRRAVSSRSKRATADRVNLQRQDDILARGSRRSRTTSAGCGQLGVGELVALAGVLPEADVAVAVVRREDPTSLT